MSLSDIFKIIRGQYSINSYEQINEEIFSKNLRNTFMIQGEFLYSEFISILKENDLNIENFRFNTSVFPQFIYVEEFIPVAVFITPIDNLSDFCNSINIQRYQLKKLWQEGKYSKFFTMVHQGFTLEIFTNHYMDIPKEKVYDVFKNVYTNCEMNFSMLSIELIQYVYKNKDKKKLENTLNNIADKNGYIRIYRGEGSNSTNIKNAYSWTTNLNTANYFGFRCRQNGIIYRGKVHKSKVLDYITLRDEFEIITIFKNVEDIQIINKYTTGYEDFDNWDNVVFRYRNLMNYLRKLKKEIFNPNGIHGLLHIQRVTLLALLMSSKLNLDNKDIRILEACSLLHDIGRDTDDADFLHGEMAVKKIKSKPYISEILNSLVDGKEDRYICLQIIIGHAITDKLAERKIMTDENIINKKRAISLLKRFKDIDGLDRVRLRFEFDEKYLRYPESSDFIGVSYELLMNVEQIQ